MNNKRSFQRRVLTALCLVLLIFFLMTVFVTVYAGGLFRRIGRYDPQQSLSPEQVASLPDPSDIWDPGFSGPVLQPEDVTFPSESSQMQAPAERIHILLIGQDRREGESRQRSDSMILCTVDQENKTITLTSFLRDCYVQIPGYRAGKLNAAYAWGGMLLLEQTLAVNFGIPVDACVEVDFSGFQKIIDLLGGVDIQLSKAEADYFRKENGWLTTAGENHLDGAQALEYARLRAIDSDFGRTARQRKILAAVLEKSRECSLSEMMALLDALLPLITTDMTDAEILNYTMELVPLLSGSTLITQQIPADGMYENAWVGSQSVLLLDMEKNRKLLRDTLFF